MKQNEEEQVKSFTPIIRFLIRKYDYDGRYKNDLESDAWLACLLNIRKCRRLAPDHARAYIRLCIKGAICDRIRVNIKRKMLSLDEVVYSRNQRSNISLSELEAVDRSITEEEHVRRIKSFAAFTSELSPGARNILTSHYAEGRSLEDLASMTGMTEQGVSRLHHRALQEAAVVLRPRFHPHAPRAARKHPDCSIPGCAYKTGGGLRNGLCLTHYWQGERRKKNADRATDSL